MLEKDDKPNNGIDEGLGVEREQAGDGANNDVEVDVEDFGGEGDVDDIGGEGDIEDGGEFDAEDGADMLYDVVFLSNDEEEVREATENIRRWCSKGKEGNDDEARTLEAKPSNED